MVWIVGLTWCLEYHFTGNLNTFVNRWAEQDFDYNIPIYSEFSDLVHCSLRLKLLSRISKESPSDQCRVLTCAAKCRVALKIILPEGIEQSSCEYSQPPTVTLGTLLVS
jgi:hypothetical protein